MLAFFAGMAGACGNDPPPRDLDAYICGDAAKPEDQRETDPDVIAASDCIEVYDETDADDGEEGTFVGRYEKAD